MALVTNQPLKWHGGKSYLAAWLHSLAPPSVHDDPEHGYTHRNIAFAGGLGEVWNWAPVEGISETVNDVDRRLANFYAVLSDELLADSHERLRRVELRNMPAADFIRKYDHPRALFYCDPPPMHQTRSSTGEYGANEMTETQHFDLLKLLSHIKGKFMLSGYPSPMYDGDAKRFGWNCHQREIDNKASSAKSKQKKIECVWTNY